MRKRYKIKNSPCGLCKPHKKGIDKRWKARYIMQERVDNEEINRAYNEEPWATYEQEGLDALEDLLNER